jgi:NADPH:quinone reductase
MASTMQAWRLHEYGEPLDVLQLEDAPIPQPEAAEVRVAVEGFALNLNDLERITGGNMMVRPEFPYSPGMEVMGVVEACGAGAEHLAGRRVVATTKGAHGGWAQFAICPAAGVFEVPDSIDLPEAAAIYFPFHLAWLGLFDRAALQPGDSVLIHAGAGGSGSAAIQLAVDAGARVFATAGGSRKIDLCRDLGAEVAIDYTAGGFADAVLEATDHQGVDVVFDNVGEAVFEDSLRCTRYNGRYVMMGFASNKLVADEPFLVPRRLMLSNLKLCTVMLAYQSPEMVGFLKSAMGWNVIPADLGARVHAEIMERMLAGRVRPVVGEVAEWNHVPAAIDAMARRDSIGRTVVLVPRP